MKTAFLLLLAVALTSSAAEIKRIPPPGIAVPDADRTELQSGIAALGKEIAALRKDLAAKPDALAQIADVEIFHKSADWALRYDEFFNEKQIATAKSHLAIGMQRAKELRAGKPSWDKAAGLVVRGYRSEIDGSVQPYGLVIPDDWKPGETTPRRLDFWLHGRAEKLSELAFIEDRLRSRGEFPPEGVVAAAPPPQTVPAAPSPRGPVAAGAPQQQSATGAPQPRSQPIVCHLYGRFCNANKFAGERDLFEALADIQKHYQIDMQRLVVRGFSMGGAACWQFATHHSGMWAAAAPGAGFAETAEFFHSFAPGKTPPPWWEQVLWRWYDCTTMAANLSNTSVVAYSGEIDGQKQAADIMVKYAKAEGLEFPHIIGSNMPHKYDAESKVKIEELVSTAAKKGSNERPRELTLATYTLRYNRMKWLRLVAMEKHWEEARITVGWRGPTAIEAASAGATREGISLLRSNKWNVSTRNVTAFDLGFPAEEAKFGEGREWWKNVDLVVDGESVTGFVGNKTWTVHFKKVDGRWIASAKPADRTAGKQHGLQGPIDDAFMSSFVFVRPTGKPLSDTIGAWANSELDHATEFWRRVFRGDAPVKDDTAITADDIKNSNLILWGDPSSNAVLKNMAALSVRETGHSGDPLGLPYQWNADTLVFHGVKYDAAHHAPILIFPNPLNPQKYVVLNSGPTFREEALLNNSDQTPKLPDWAIVNLDTPPDWKWPGQIIDAGFFDEEWRLGK